MLGKIGEAMLDREVQIEIQNGSSPNRVGNFLEL
jgi:hypothetical protein